MQYCIVYLCTLLYNASQQRSTGPAGGRGRRLRAFAAGAPGGCDWPVEQNPSEGMERQGGPCSTGLPSQQLPGGRRPWFVKHDFCLTIRGGSIRVDSWTTGMGARRTWNCRRRGGTRGVGADADRRETSIPVRTRAADRRINTRPAISDEGPIDTGSDPDAGSVRVTANRRSDGATG